MSEHTVQVELLSKHSSGKDHIAMTGGTLGADKRVTGARPLRLQHDFFPVTTLVTAEPGEARDRLFAGIHSIEHALASPDGGDLRARLATTSELGTEYAARLIDMSPYIPGLLDADDATGLPIGFRSTFVLEEDGAKLSTSALLAAYRRALGVIRELLSLGEPVPFSTPEACGQYNLHSAEAAIELIKLALTAAASPEQITETQTETQATELYVCDLRLVKPRLPEAFDQQVLDLLGGHLISQRIEQDAPHLTAGNFGCSTGEYLMIANPGNLPRDTLLARAHREVAGTLAETGSYTGPNPIRHAAAEDARFSLQHIEKYRPDALPG